jgi:hypothetical protein
MQRDKHFCSLPLRLLLGLVMHALKHLSRTVCKHRWVVWHTLEYKAAAEHMFIA